MINYPFFDPEMRRINVSAEMVGYRPVPMDELHALVTGESEIVPFRGMWRGNSCAAGDIHVEGVGSHSVYTDIIGRNGA